MTTRLKFLNGLTAFVYSALILLIPGPVLGQTTPLRDPNAVALASQALQALAGGTALTDVTLQGSVTYSAASGQQAGTATLVARGSMESLLSVNVPAGQRKEIRNGAAGVWIGLDGTPHAMAATNCYLDADWFSPAFSLLALATDSTLIITLDGQETHNAQQVYHLSLFHYLSGQPPDVISLVQRVSQMDLYLDTTSLLPAALDFNVYSENDASASVGVPTEIRFNAYQSFNGVWVPTHIQKYVQGFLALDFTATSVAVDSGVADSVFALPPLQPVVPATPGTPSGGGAD
jgi:hypothetical protein